MAATRIKENRIWQEATVPNTKSYSFLNVLDPQINTRQDKILFLVYHRQARQLLLPYLEKRSILTTGARAPSSHVQ